MHRKIPLPVVFFLGLLTLAPALADTSVAYPAAKLRGYGTVSGTVTTTTSNSQPGSVLAITCEDEDKAKLLLAKFLSDQQTFPGVDKMEIKAQQWGIGWARFGGTPVSAYQVGNQGFLSAVRLGTKVLVIASPTREGLVALTDKSLAANTAPVISESETKVPMWLDRFDQYGFRFYYWTGQVAPGQKEEDYDFKGDFTYARDHGVGMVFWDNISKIMGADGQTDQTHWGWAEGLAKQNNLPVAINLSAGNFSLPTWIGNRFREDLMQPMPGFLGDSMSIANWRGTEGKAGELVWGATPALDATLATLQASVRHFNDDPNITSWLEPHGELSQGGDDFMGYGPGVDASYRDFLREQYGSVDKVNQAWFGQSDTLKSWDDVHAPELASFLGWGPDAVDLGGTWRIANTDGAPPAEWSSPTFDDSTWLTVTAPGDDRNLFLPKKPAVYRRTFDLPADWLGKHPKVWIYLWDLNAAFDEKAPPVSIYLNGQKVAEDHCRHPRAHWMSAESTSFLKPGPNQLSLTLPSGFLGYRVYLSPVEPKQYPNLGEGLNTQWVDLVDWRQKTRVDSVRRGMEMIREVDPNRGITMMSPDYALDGTKALAQDYGGEFHNTGYMSGFWADMLPSLMRGSDLPFSLEPGGPAHDLNEFKTVLGLWHTEAIQQIDYFIHIGDVMWNPEIRKFFETNQPLIHLFGKYHLPKAELAFLWSARAKALTEYPWTNDVNTNLMGGWMCKGVGDSMLGHCPRDEVSESDFARGNAAAYKVIIDTNTSIMDDKLLGQIEKYVRDGGIFVTFIQTGRHSPTKPDSWPISKLTGYDVLTIEKFDANGNGMSFDPKDPNPAGSRCQHLQPAPGQQIYLTQEAWMKTPWVTGLRMKKASDDVQDLVLWEDGTVAVGMRKLGKGTIIEFGPKGNGQPWLGIDIAALMPILDWAGVKPNSVDVTFDNPKITTYSREYESNNGLFNLSVLWNTSNSTAVKATLAFKDHVPATARDAVTGQEIALQDGRLVDVPLEPLQTRIFITPRHQITDAPADWFDLQRKWWRASIPITKPFPKLSDRFVRDLDEDWRWHPMEEKDDPTPWTQPGFDDSAWIKLGLGAWNAVPERENIKHGFLRRTFTVPKEWDQGRVELWLQTIGHAFADTGRVWLDGKPIGSWWAESGISGLDFDGALAPGTTHVLAVEVKSNGQIVGVTSDAWINYVPKPQVTLDLAGPWTICKDDLFHDTGTVSWPGPYEAQSLWRTIRVPRENEGKTVMLMMEADRPFNAFINGTMVRYSSADSPTVNSRVGLNITPWVHFGQDNRIQLVSHYGKGTLRRVALDFYDRGTYP
jgi:hypothetical protein